MTSLRKTALVAGIFYLVTFVSIPTLALYGPVHETNFIVGPGPDAPVRVGAFLEIVVALAGIGTAVTLYPVVKRQNQGAALGFVGTRVLEAAGITTGVVALLTLVGLRQADASGAEAAALLTTGKALVATYDAAFLLSQSLMPVFNALLLGSLLYRSRLVPRVLPGLGLVGAPLLLASDLAILFGVLDRLSPLAAVAALPIALWEFSLGVWLVVKGFRPVPILTSGIPQPHGN
ncbi:MAG: DUF4386 domain-containing protein, partial [Actinomycetes bacterium]